MGRIFVFRFHYSDGQVDFEIGWFWIGLITFLIWRVS
jgi:hypothetical protein